MSCEMFFDESDIRRLPFEVGDTVTFRNEKVTITSIYIRDYDLQANDIIVTFSNGDYTFHDSHELEV